MASKKEQTWTVELDEERMEVIYRTAADDKIRQRFKWSDVHLALHDRIGLRGLKVTLEERTSQVKARDVDLKMAARAYYADLFQQGLWSKPREGGGPRKFDIRIEAVALMKGTAYKAVQAALDALEDEIAEAYLESEKVRAKVEEMQAKAADLDLSDLG